MASTIPTMGSAVATSLFSLSIRRLKYDVGMYVQESSLSYSALLVSKRILRMIDALHISHKYTRYGDLTFQKDFVSDQVSPKLLMKVGYFEVCGCRRDII